MENLTLNHPVFISIKTRNSNGKVSHEDKLIPYEVYKRIEHSMTEKEALFMKFFTQAYSKCMVPDMTIQQIIDWENELNEIALEARATQQGAAKARKERESSLTKSERDKLITQPDLGVSDSINAVNRRKDRMTNADKVVASLRTLGHSEEEIKIIMGTVKVNETSQNTLAAKEAVKEAIAAVPKAEKVYTAPKEPVDVTETKQWNPFG